MPVACRPRVHFYQRILLARFASTQSVADNHSRGSLEICEGHRLFFTRRQKSVDGKKSVDGEEEEQEEAADVTKPSLMHHRQSAVISKGNILIYKVGLIQGDTAAP